MAAVQRRWAPGHSEVAGDGAGVSARAVSVVRRRRVVLHVDRLELPAGATTALVGPNGSGKSTLLHAIAGLVPVAEGALVVRGRAPAAGRPDVASVLQATTVAPPLPITVRQVVAMGRYATVGGLRRFGARDRAAVDAALVALELGELEGRQLSELSGGQRQRALVAQAIAQSAELMLLDEPLTGVDLASAVRIQAAVDAHRNRGGTAVVATHDLAEAARADVVVLLAGRVVAAGAPAEVLTRANLTAAYQGRLVRLADDVLVVDDGSHHEHHDHHGT